jgi:nicotinamidase-related amidase
MSANLSEAPPVGGIAGRSAAFLNYLDDFIASLESAALPDLLATAGGPPATAVVAVDVVQGFCVAGPLAGPRVAAIVEPIERLFREAHAAGVRRFAVLRDSHDPAAPEFAQFGPHCIVGTAQSALVDELRELPFAGSFFDVPKNAISVWAAGTRFSEWVGECERSGVSTFVVVGDCTDLCVYQTAMQLKLRANAENRELTVVVPMDCVDTYDLQVESAQQAGIMPHDGDLLHAVFLYHLRLNGIRVVKSLTAGQ